MDITHPAPRLHAERSPAAPPRGRSHIFLSFKTEERDAALRLRDALVSAGYAVWWQEDIQCGREWHGHLDAALAAAGCVVVLWSTESIASRWVRHEASQAIARHIYAPVRLAPMVIESPFDRIQATDLINWNGETTHPGWLNLLKRVEELLPPPLSTATRVRCWLRGHVGTVMLALFAIIATGLLLQVSRTLDHQLARQGEFATQIQRTLQPLEDVSVSVDLTLDRAAPGVANYVATLRKALLVQDGKGAVRVNLPPGVSSRPHDDGTVRSISVVPSSSFWPAVDAPDWLGLVVGYVDLFIGFRRDGDEVAQAPQSRRSASAWDLSFLVRSYDPRSQQPREDLTLEWELQTDTLTVSFSDTPTKRDWTSTPRIVSVPDLEASLMMVTILSSVATTATGRYEDGIPSGRRYLVLSNLYLSCVGLRRLVKGQDMTRSRSRYDLGRYQIAVAELQKLE